jgi:hypothetical protein
VIVAFGDSWVCSTTARHAPGRSPLAVPTKVPCVEVAAISTPATVSLYVVAAAAAGTASCTSAATVITKIARMSPLSSLLPSRVPQGAADRGRSYTFARPRSTPVALRGFGLGRAGYRRRMDATKLGHAGLVGWRRHVGERVAHPVSRHTRLTFDQARAVVGAIFVVLAARHVVRILRTAREAQE